MAKLLVALSGRCKISNKYVTKQITRKSDVNSFVMVSIESNPRSQIFFLLIFNILKKNEWGFVFMSKPNSSRLNLLLDLVICLNRILINYKVKNHFTLSH